MSSNKEALRQVVESIARQLEVLYGEVEDSRLADCAADLRSALVATEKRILAIKIELSEKEVHMMGKYVGVCWNTKTETKRLMDEDGTTYRAEIQVRDGEPYIQFIWIRGDEKSGFYERDVSPVDGGLEKSEAALVVEELQRALRYLDQLEAL